MPFYYRTYFVVPVVASFTVIITAIVIAWACLKRATIMQSESYTARSDIAKRSAIQKPE